MERVRGVVLLLAAGLAIYRGWQIHIGRYSLMAYGLGALSFCLALWHLTRKESR